jgi:hypothetical protein
MKMFDHKDFAANPGKYMLFKTAKVNGHVFTENGTDDLEAGQYVAIKHMRNAWNGLRHREEPVYSITANGKVWGVMFASSLSNFVL